MADIPDWALKYREKGTEIRYLNGQYYLYRVTSKYDPTIKRSRKITLEYLGKITPDGLLKPKAVRVMDELHYPTNREYGASSFILTECSDTIDLLKTHFPDEWKEIAVCSIVRFFHSAPMKNMQLHYVSSHLFDAIPDARISPGSVSNLLHYTGLRRQRVVDFMSNFVQGEQCVIDLTHVFSRSENVIAATLGHNSGGGFIPQLNIVLLTSVRGNHPSFFRIVPGSIGDVSTIKMTMREAGISGADAVLVGDKGFYSKENMRFLERERMRYILPLKRDSAFIDYSPARGDIRTGFDGCFMFDDRVIWHRMKKTGKRRVILFLDEYLRTEEGRDMIARIKDGKGKMSSYHEQMQKMGTIAVITNTTTRAHRVYELLKRRIEIEQTFDTFKNTLHADRSYMRSDVSMQGWMFINFVALLLYYRVYDLLFRKKMLKKYSPKDVLLHLSLISKMKIGDRWVLSEIPKQSRTLMEKLGIEVSIP